MKNNEISFFRFLITNMLWGSRKYYYWIFALLGVTILGFHMYARQIAEGMSITGMSDQVVWGLYISNFTFTVGLAAGAVMLVIPAYIYNREAMYEIVIFGEILAVASIIVCILFVTADIGRPERIWHMIPFLGEFNWPQSMLAWDTLVLIVYLLLNLYIIFYILYSKFHGRVPRRKVYIWAVYLSIFWAFTLHMVTAFLYNGLGAKPFWNSAIIAPRFLASAFVAGPAIIVITLKLLDKFAGVKFAFEKESLNILRNIITISLSINTFFLLSELFTEFYTASVHVASIKYIFFGLHGHNNLVPFMWSSIILNTVALIIFYTPRLYKRQRIFFIATVLTLIGIWLEKGMGFIVPGFIPTPLGEIVEYTPSLEEIMISIGIATTGILVYSLALKAAMPIIKKVK